MNEADEHDGLMRWSLGLTTIWFGVMVSLMRWWGGDWPWGADLSGYARWMIPASLFSGMAVSGLAGWATWDWVGPRDARSSDRG